MPLRLGLLPQRRCCLLPRRAPAGGRYRQGCRADAGLSNGNGAAQQEARLKDWPRKSDLYILRSDGMSCSRETVEGKALSLLS